MAKTNLLTRISILLLNELTDDDTMNFLLGFKYPYVYV